jgi:DNA repair protein RecN (Recombination protein N)
VLEELRIRGLGVIGDATVPLGPGLTVLTGETGAGKTMIVTGLQLLFGGRGDSARVRSGSEQATVDGRLRLAAGSPARQRVADAGGELDDDSGSDGVGDGSDSGSDSDGSGSGNVRGSAASGDSNERGRGDCAGASGLVLRRTVSAAGRSRAYVGGAPAPVAVLAELSEHLLALHGQADQALLTRPAQQRATLDRFAGVDLEPFRSAYTEWRAAEEQLHDRLTHAAQLRREADLLHHGIGEIAAADPQPGEDAELAAEAARLAHADALRAAARGAHDRLLGDPDSPMSDAPDVAALLGAAARGLAAVSGADSRLDGLAARLADLAAVTADLGAEFASYGEQLSSDPGRLEQLEARRAVLSGLDRKYGDGTGLAAVLDWAGEAAARLAGIDVSDEALAGLRARRDGAARRTASLAAQVRAARSSAARVLGAAITAELAGLAMPSAEVVVAVRPRPVVSGAPTLVVGGAGGAHGEVPGGGAGGAQREVPGGGAGGAHGEAPGGGGPVGGECGVGPDGADEVELCLRPQPGMPALPLARSASGGELSRVMLAVEVCLSGADPVPTMVFDEVDAGVGGRAAIEVGRRLARLAADRQVLVVTHLAQVAAYADAHLVVDRPVDTDVDRPVETNIASKADRRAASRPGEADRGRIVTSAVRPVDGEDRLAELARMLGGTDSAAAREHAAELLHAAVREHATRDRTVPAERGRGAGSRPRKRRKAAPDRVAQG